MIDRFVQAKKDVTLAKYPFKLICCHSTTTTLIQTSKKDKTNVGLGLSNHYETSQHPTTTTSTQTQKYMI